MGKCEAPLSQGFSVKITSGKRGVGPTAFCGTNSEGRHKAAQNSAGIRHKAHDANQLRSRHEPE